MVLLVEFGVSSSTRVAWSSWWRIFSQYSARIIFIKQSPNLCTGTDFSHGFHQDEEEFCQFWKWVVSSWFLSCRKVDNASFKSGRCLTGIVSEPTKFERIHQFPRYTLSSSSVAMWVWSSFAKLSISRITSSVRPIPAWFFWTMYHEWIDRGCSRICSVVFSITFFLFEGARKSSRATKVPVRGVAQVVDCHGVTISHQERRKKWRNGKRWRVIKWKFFWSAAHVHGWDDCERQVRAVWAMWCNEWSDNSTTDSVQVCLILHFVHVHVRRVIHVILSTNGLTVVEGVLVVVHTITQPFVIRSWMSRSLMFTPPVGDSRLLSVITDIITRNFAMNSCWDSHRKWIVGLLSTQVSPFDQCSTHLCGEFS